jgi:hypothetical protein
MEKSEYLQGQEDLINEIKKEVSIIIEKSEGSDVMFDILHLLKSLKPKK